MNFCTWPQIFINFIAMRKSFCLESSASFKEINGSPHNRSTSKQLYSFSKDSRFKDPVVYCDNLYEISGNLKNKGKGMGYGQKSDFTKDLTSSPGSSKYNISTVFDKNIEKKRGCSIALSREEIPSKGHIPLDPLRVPAPNKYYNMNVGTGTSGAKYTMRDKTKIIDKTMSIYSQNNFPGAGRYENPEALSPRGNYMHAKHKGTGATMFNPRRSSRFFEFKKQIPGPGSYNEVNAFSDQGHYPITNTTGYGKRFFDKEHRMAEFENKATKNLNPGPGSYRSSSDFGQYDGDVYIRN